MVTIVPARTAKDERDAWTEFSGGELSQEDAREHVHTSENNEDVDKVRSLLSGKLHRAESEFRDLFSACEAARLGPPNQPPLPTQRAWLKRKHDDAADRV